MATSRLKCGWLLLLLCNANSADASAVRGFSRAEGMMVVTPASHSAHSSSLTSVHCGLTHAQVAPHCFWPSLRCLQAEEKCSELQQHHEANKAAPGCLAYSFNSQDERAFTNDGRAARGCAWYYDTPHVDMRPQPGWTSAVSSGSYCGAGTEAAGGSCATCPAGKWAADQFREGKGCEAFPEFAACPLSTGCADPVKGHFLECGVEGGCTLAAQGLHGLGPYCAAGYWRNDTDSGGAVCLPCASGKAKIGPGNLECALCAKGYYNPSTGAARCIPCPRGQNVCPLPYKCCN